MPEKRTAFFTKQTAAPKGDCVSAGSDAEWVCQQPNAEDGLWRINGGHAVAEKVFLAPGAHPKELSPQHRHH